MNRPTIPVTPISSARYISPIGPVRLRLSKRGLVALEFEDEMQDLPPVAESKVSEPLVETCKQQLDDYFEGTRQQFDLPLDLQSTPFTLGVWKALRAIDYGKQQSYRDIATAIGSPRAVRAVGNANGRNPVPIIIPCHRVVASNGSLGGYSCGLWRKKWLLDHELKYV